MTRGLGSTEKILISRAYAKANVYKLTKRGDAEREMSPRLRFRPLECDRFERECWWLRACDERERCWRRVPLGVVALESPVAGTFGDGLLRSLFGGVYFFCSLNLPMLFTRSEREPVAEGSRDGERDAFEGDRRGGGERRRGELSRGLSPRSRLQLSDDEHELCVSLREGWRSLDRDKLNWGCRNELREVDRDRERCWCRRPFGGELCREILCGAPNLNSRRGARLVPPAGNPRPFLEGCLLGDSDRASDRERPLRRCVELVAWVSRECERSCDTSFISEERDLRRVGDEDSGSLSTDSPDFNCPVGGWTVSPMTSLISMSAACPRVI